ncbi:AAA family ATPase [Dokdonella sp.]|uniref:AAA family ATPase n=1 Tax=Dokdonella sp. TaxID=2291710 RepID=UPI003C5D32DE
MKLPRLARPPLWRIILLIVVAWLIGSALFAPGLNPLVRLAIPLDAEIGTMMGIVRYEMSEARDSAERYWRMHGDWPANALAIGEVDDNGLIRLDIPEPMELSYQFGQGFGPETDLRGTVLSWRFNPETAQWRCMPGQPSPPTRWLFAECQPPSAGAGGTLGVMLIVSILTLAAALVWLAVLDPMMRTLQASPRRLRRLPLSSLPGMDRRLRLLRRLDTSLAAADVAAEDWREAVHLVAADSSQRAESLALRIGATSATSDSGGLPGTLFVWNLPNELPVALDQMLVLFVDPAIPARLLVRHLRAKSTGQDVLMVVSPNVRSDASLLAFASDPGNLCVAIDQSTLSEWMLNPVPTEVLIGVLARQLKITRISPYQTRGGVTRSAVFFGREQLLARVINREPGNYLLVGGRQLGKTSLMKAIERRFESHPRVRCHYLSMRDHRLAPRLAQAAGLPLETPPEEALRRLAQHGTQQRLLLLLDETDLFLRDEASHGYPQLAQLRALSEEGLCHFMLAGFWDLYEAIALDFASPIRNFGEVIRLGALEADACAALASEPLARLGVRFESRELVEAIVSTCGQRANLVAMVCQCALESLDRGERIITTALAERALRSDAIGDALAGWSRLSPEPRACALDRAIVYRVAQRSLCGESGLTIAGWLDELDAVGVRIPSEAVRRAFSRLQLAYVLLRDDEAEQWRFAVPQQARQFESGEVDALLERELRDLDAAWSPADREFMNGAGDRAARNPTAL